MEKDTTLKDQIIEAMDGRLVVFKDEIKTEIMVAMDEKLCSFKDEIIGGMNEKFRAQGVLLEDMQEDIDTLVDGQEMLHERIDRVQDTVSSIDEKVERLDARMTSVEIV